MVEYGRKGKGNNIRKRERDHEEKSSGVSGGSRTSVWNYYSSMAPTVSVQSMSNISNRKGQSSYQQGSMQSGLSGPKCISCGRAHSRPYRAASYTCHNYGQVGHIKSVPKQEGTRLKTRYIHQLVSLRWLRSPGHLLRHLELVTLVRV